MRVTYVQYAGLSLDVLKKVEPGEEIYIEEDIMFDIPEELYDRWEANYNEAIEISNELFKEIKKC